MNDALVGCEESPFWTWYDAPTCAGLMLTRLLDDAGWFDWLRR